jgi:GNAT superfamily N-acetyltransferase
MNNRFSLINVRTWHLHFEGQLPSISNICELVFWKDPSPDEYFSLYKLVGEPWGWSGRLLLSTDELEEKLNSPCNEVWLFKTDNKLRGFFEIDHSRKGEAEIVYLRLLPEETGKGFGKIFLDAAIATASGKTNDRVWLHTCEYDHPLALTMYMKAGFVIEKETIESEFYFVEFLGKEKKNNLRG